MNGTLTQIFVIQAMLDPMGLHNIVGAFSTRRQAVGWLQYECDADTKANFLVVERTVFQPEGQNRVWFLFEPSLPYSLTTDYEPEEVRQQRVLKRQAWEVLTPEQRAAIGFLKEPDDT